MAMHHAIDAQRLCSVKRVSRKIPQKREAAECGISFVLNMMWTRTNLNMSISIAIPMVPRVGLVARRKMWFHANALQKIKLPFVTRQLISLIIIAQFLSCWRIQMLKFDKCTTRIIYMYIFYTDIALIIFFLRDHSSFLEVLREVST